ncbi:MAG: hypothetical protein OXR72_08935 [Gemmatimonadota bacterium]|nr:hypothetical protein [Gemmatimonadota bacterium]
MNRDDLIVVRVLFQNIEDGDRRKFAARSNDSPTGGGARDLRFRPESEFWPFFKLVFPNRRGEARKSKGVYREIEILSGRVQWQQFGQEKSAILEVWPSTDARPNEARIAQISRLGIYDLIKDDPVGGRSVFMLFQQKNGTIRLHFTTEHSLLSHDWDPTIREFATAWIRSGVKSAFFDLESKRRYPK